MLCVACKALFQGSDSPWYYIKETETVTPAYQHHHSPAQLHKAARDGCHICSIIWKKLAPGEREVLLATWNNAYLHRASQAIQSIFNRSIAYYSWSPIWWSVEDFGIRFQFGDAPFWKKIVFRLLPFRDEVCPDEENHEAQFTEEMVASPASPESSVYWPRPSEDHNHVHIQAMWSPHTQRLAQRWYRECTDHHDLCRMKDVGNAENGHVHQDFQPTRILDLADNKIRLDIEPEKRAGQRYASLTHRWSLKPETMPRLNPEILIEWRENINPAILTPTFRDAISAARKLQIRYIWIDSLCILQTGHGWAEDWQREAAVMGEVYRHAILNVQAGRDEEALEMGLFRAPTNREIDPFRIEIDRQVVKPRARGRPSTDPITIQGTYSIIEEDFARDELIGNPINRRGWVLQERLLSHRIIHFGAQQVFWECRELLACETFPEGLPKTIPKTMARAATSVVRNPTFDPKTIIRNIKRQMTVDLANDPTNTLGAITPVTAAKPTMSVPIDPKLPVPSFPSLTVHRDLFAWFYLAELYSACSLTRETDKLVAISGLAQIFGSPAFHSKAADVVAYLRNLALPRSGGAVTDLQIDLDASMSEETSPEAIAITLETVLNTNDVETKRKPSLQHHHKTSQHLLSHHAHLGSRPTGDYLAGLWRYELIPCLLWHMANGRQHNGLPSARLPIDIKSGRAPSWSWASVNGLLHASIYQNWTTGIDGVVLAEVSGAQTTKSYSSNSWGGVEAGRIVLASYALYQSDVIWPSVEQMDDLAELKVRAHMSEVHGTIIRRIKLNTASVVKQRVLKADVCAFVDDMREFSLALRRSAGGGSTSGSSKHSITSLAGAGGRYEIALVPLIGLQRRRADWSRPEGYVDETFEWHGLVVGLSRRGGRSQSRPPSRTGSREGSPMPSLRGRRSHQNLSVSAGLGAGGVAAALAPILNLHTPRLTLSPTPDGGHWGNTTAHFEGDGTKGGQRQMGDELDFVAERLGYFRCKDTDVFKNVMEKKGPIEILML
jgi:hypothetical protein